MKPIALLVCEQITPFFISVPRMVFETYAPQEHRRSIVMCAQKPGRIPVEGGLFADVQHGLELFKDADLIIIPFWQDLHLRPDDELIAALQEAHARGTRIAGLCRGGVVLAYAGLLNGRRAATHWCDAPAFEALFPLVKLDPKALYVEEGAIITSAGVAAGIDCCLHIQRIMEGAACANETARRMVAPPFREGGQAQFIEHNVPLRTVDERINSVLADMERRLAEPFDPAAAARQAAMSERSFYRTFRRSTGMTPAQWLGQARLRRAQELLENTAASIEQVAQACGYASAVTFRQRFREAFDVSPSAWRHTFQSAGDAAPHS